MSIVTRANKAGSGTPNYAPDTTILSDEVNLDFNTLYDDYDGNITNANIAVGANIDGTKLATGTITGTQIAAGSILNVHVNSVANIQRTKLLQPAQLATSILPSLTFNSETTIATLTFTVVGGPVIFTVAGCINHAANPSAGTITWRWKRDGTAVQTVTYLSASQGDIIGVPIPAFVDVSFVTGSHTWTLTAEVSSGTLETSSSPGSIYAVEVR